MAAIVLLAAVVAFAEEKEPRERPLPRIGATAVPTVRTISGSPLTIWVGDDTSFQVVNSQFPGQGQIFPTNCTQTVADAGIFFATGGAIYSPAFDDHPCGGVAPQGTAWTPVSISATTGNGTSSNPYRVEVIADAGNTGVRLTAVYSYVNGEGFFRIAKTFCARTAAVNGNIYLGGDLYLAGSDAGIPFREQSSGAPGGRDCNQGGYNILLVPTTPASRYTATNYFDTWAQIFTRGDLPNTVSTGCIDNGAALQWARGIAAGTCTTVTSAVSFGPIPSVAQFSVGSVSPSEGAPGQSLNVTVSGIGFGQATRFDFGAGITVGATTINSSTQATVALAIGANATTGPRNVTGTNAQGLTSTAFNAFNVVTPCAPVNGQNTAITFTGRTTGCSPAAGTCQPGETINFAPLFFGRTDTNCDSFVWNFGDGVTSTQKVTTHAYTTPGRYTVTMTVSNANSTATVATDVQVGTTPQPVIPIQFTAVPGTIELGRSSTLSWSAGDATQVTITPEVGTRPGPRGSVIVAPRQTTTYTLTAVRGNIINTATTTVTVSTTPNVVVPRLPPAMVQIPGGPAATASFLVANVGGVPANVTITHASGFFTLSPTSFTLPPFTGQSVTITPTVTQPGAYEITALVNVAGFAAVRVPIRLGILASSAGADPQPEQRRVDLSGTQATATGEARFVNRGTNSVDAIVTTDVPWIIPEVQRVTILPGQTLPVRFRIDRALRGEVEGGIGSLAGSISLVYIKVGAFSRDDDGKIGTGTGSSTSTVTVVDTIPPAVTSAGIPALTPGQVALFIPGVGHVQGSVGVFASDLTILHKAALAATNRVEMYYTRSGAAATLLSTIPSLSRNSNVLLGDFVATVFNGTNDLGTLQIRATNIDDLSVASVVQNVTGTKGNYGSAVPVFRSDRAVGSGESMTLTGLRAGTGVHTNMYIQETSGNTVQVRTEFLDAAANTIDTRLDNVAVFGLTQLVSVVPSGAVTARLTHNGGAGRFVAYATPVDDLSGDTWTVVDWNRFYGLSATDEKIIPVAGTVHGANNTYFRTDLEVTNLSTTTAGTATFRFVPSSGAPIERTVNLAPRQSVAYLDVVANLFGTTTDLVGFIKVLSSAVPLTVSSRTYTTGTDPGTFGSAVPTLGASLPLATGSTLRIAGLEDASTTTVNSGRGATFRTNVGLVETRGQTATVRLTLSFSFSAGTRINGSGQASLDVTLAPNQFMQLNGIASRILGPSRDQLGDLKGMELAIQVIDGTGGVAVFTSSIDNATGDSILRTE